MTDQQLNDVWTYVQTEPMESAVISDSEGFAVGYIVGVGLDPKKSAEKLAWRIIADHNLNLMAMHAEPEEPLKHPATPSFLEYPSFEDSANFDPVPPTESNRSNEMEYEIALYGVNYTVEPLIDDGELFAVIRSVTGLEQYGSDELPGLFTEDVQRELARELLAIMQAERDE